MSLRECYEEIRSLGLLPIEKLDSFDVVSAVSEYRRIWKPELVKVVLLAESHVHTIDSDFKNVWSYPTPNPLHHGNFVRFVYCLANGESSLVRIPTNKGTWQFWKLLFSCLNPITGPDTVVPVLRRFTPVFVERMREKIALLTSLKRAGIWLVDASIVGFTEEDENTVKTRVMRQSWKNYVGTMLKELRPTPHFIIVGLGVERALRKEIERLDPDCVVIRQPNARMKHGYPDYPKCFETCSRFRD